MKHSFMEILDAHIHKKQLILDYYYQNPQKYIRVSRFTDQSGEYLRTVGYLKAQNFLDNIRYSGIPVWVRFDNGFFTEPDPEDNVSLETSSTLYDFYYSDAAVNFVKGMTTGIKLPPMDLQKVGMIAMLAVGVLAGCYFLGVF